MATIISHSIVGGTLAYLSPLEKKTKVFVFFMCLLPIIPDFDYLGFVLKVPYDSFWGHRGFTHSILFCFLFSSICLLLTYKVLDSKKYFYLLFLYFMAMFTHPLLDAMTNGGLGIAFYSPYNLTRYFFPWRPIEVSPMGSRFFSERGLVVLISEFYWIMVPCLLLILSKLAYLKSAQDKINPSNLD